MLKSREFAAIGLKLLQTFDFASVGQSTITLPDDLLGIKSILESSYADGISSVENVHLDEVGNVVGTFRDVVTPRLTKVFSFAIAGDGDLTYKMLNPQDVDDFADITHFSEPEWLNFAAIGNPEEAKGCKKGIACGKHCIHKGYTCHADHATPEKQKESRDLVTKLRNEAKKAGTFKPKLQISKEKKEAEAKALNEKIVRTKNTDDTATLPATGNTKLKEVAKDLATLRVKAIQEGSQSAMKDSNKAALKANIEPDTIDKALVDTYNSKDFRTSLESGYSKYASREKANELAGIHIRSLSEATQQANRELFRTLVKEKIDPDHSDNIFASAIAKKSFETTLTKHILKKAS